MRFCSMGWGFRALAAAGLACAGFAASAQPVPRHYVDAGSYVAGDAQIEAWYTLKAALRQDFDQICGDTFCEGDYSNHQSLRFECSVERTSGLLGRCVWVFAASNEAVDPATGRIAVDARIWRCRAPLAPRTSLEALLAALAVDAPLYAPLPGTDRSIYDGLGDCL